jgi:tetratricopeptide (TPR) repeat protein
VNEEAVGRDDIVAELVAATTRACTGRGGVVLVDGEPGIGKTTIVRVVADRVRGDVDVSWGICPEDRSAPAFWPWRALIDVAPVGDERQHDLALGVRRFELLTSLADRAIDQARERPRLHVIEDLHWADVATALLLGSVATATVDAPLLVIATMRTGEPTSPELESALAEVRRRAEVRPVPPLSDDAIARLVGGPEGHTDVGLVSTIRARTGGNPLFVSELLRAAPTGGPSAQRIEAVSEAVPGRVGDLVAHRVAGLETPIAEMLTTAAVLGADGDTATLAAASGTEVTAVVELLDQARAAHLLDAATATHWSFRHQIIRDAIYERSPVTQRVGRHAQALDVLASDPSTPAPVLAHHALCGLPLVDAHRAVTLAALAGEDALIHHAYEEAVRWFTRALEVAPPDRSARWTADLLLRVGEAHRQVGAIEAAREAFVRAGELTDDPAVLARAALGYADPGADLGIAYRTDDPLTAPLLERAIAAQPADDSLTTVQLEARLAAVLYFSDEPARARSLAEVALARAQRTGDLDALGVATALFHDAFVVGQADLVAQIGESDQLLDWARSTGSTAALLTAHRARLFDLLAAGDLAAVDSEILSFTRLAEPLRVDGYLWWPALWSAARALLEGRHDVAEARAAEALELGQGAFPSLAFVNWSFQVFFLRREQGQLGDLEQATRDFAAERADVPALRVGLVFLLAETGRIDEARAALTQYDEPLLDQLSDRNWPASWFQLARAASIAGDPELAARLLAPHRHPSERCVQVSLGSVCLGAADLAAAWLLHTTGDLDAADRRYRSAEELNARIGARSWLAQAHADHARLLVQRDGPGDRDLGAQLARRARDAARQIGLAPVLAQDLAAAELRPATFRRAGSVWEVVYGERAVRLPDARGLRDLAYLLSRPGEAVSVLELAHDPGTDATADRGEVVLDERARREIRSRLRQLDDDEADAEAVGDGERAARAREERQALAEAVARDLGLGGRSRRTGDQVERARKTVSTRIRRTIATVGREHPDLGRHLERSIDTGTWCAYRPAEPLRWET